MKFMNTNLLLQYGTYLLLGAIAYLIATEVVLLLRKQKAEMIQLIGYSLLCLVLWTGFIFVILFIFDFGSAHTHLDLEWTVPYIPAIFSLGYSSYLLFRKIKK